MEYRNIVFIDREKTTPICGVYFLLKNDEIVYIGKSINIRSRLFSHQQESEFHKPKDFDRSFYIKIPKENISLIEACWIEKFIPVLNRGWNPLRKKITPEVEQLAKHYMNLALSDIAKMMNYKQRKDAITYYSNPRLF